MHFGIFLLITLAKLKLCTSFSTVFIHWSIIFLLYPYKGRAIYPDFGLLKFMYTYYYGL